MKTDKELLDIWKTLSSQWDKTHDTAMLNEATTVLKELLFKSQDTLRQGTYPADTLLVRILSKMTQEPLLLSADKITQTLRNDNHYIVNLAPGYMLKLNKDGLALVQIKLDKTNPKKKSCLDDVKHYDPAELSDEDLSADFQIATNGFINLREGKSTEYKEDLILGCGRKIFKEMMRRGKETFYSENLPTTTLLFVQTILDNEDDTTVLILPVNQAAAIVEKNKTAVIKSRPFEFQKFMTLVDADGRIHGWIRFGFDEQNTPDLLSKRVETAQPFEKINQEEFVALRDAHLISDEQKEDWYPGVSDLYFYPVREFIPANFDRTVELPKDENGFVRGLFVENQVGSKSVVIPPDEDRNNVNLREKISPKPDEN